MTSELTEMQKSDFRPKYLDLYESGELHRRVLAIEKYLDNCTCCPHHCEVNRNEGKLGKCYSRALPIVSAYTPHFGEEPGLSGTRGAGNIFFGNCNLRCIYCQNHEISQNRVAELQHEVSVERLAEIMLELQAKGCHNIGLVSPTHFTAPILKAIWIAIANGLRLPIIYNTNGYDSVEVLKLYDGVIDIYLPDIKYGSNQYGEEYSKAENYFDATTLAVKEMYRQVGSELIWKEGVITRGLVIRHLVLPNDLSDTEAVLAFIAKELNPEIHISLMAQYFPAHKALKEMLLSRKVRETEYNRALALMEKYGLHNGWAQEFESAEHYKPEFESSRVDPFGNDKDAG